MKVVPKKSGGATAARGGVSVLTIGRGRAAHLANVALGLAQQDVVPSELVVACMQPQPYALPPLPFPVRQVHVGGDALPLAAARNAAAAAATGTLLLFVDVDCIPGPSFVGDYTAASADFDGIAMGEVAYLPSGATDAGLHWAAFDAAGVRHSDRRGPPEGPWARCADYRCFWSLTFGLRAAMFRRLGGFDERYVGYGGEDTDFAKTADRAGVPIRWIRGARVYHQHHAHHMPPIHHIDSVVRNSALFREKWGYRTMEHWLYAFRLMGLTEETRRGARIVRDVTDADRALTVQPPRAPYVNTARVIEVLKARLAQVPDVAAE